MPKCQTFVRNVVSANTKNGYVKLKVQFNQALRDSQRATFAQLRATFARLWEVKCKLILKFERGVLK